MKIRLLVVACALIALGMAFVAIAPATRAQATSDACAAPWVVQSGRTSDTAANTAFYAIKWNKCTGETFVLSDTEPNGDAIMTQQDANKKITWRKFPSQ